MPTYTNKGKYLLVQSNEPYSMNLFFTTIHEVSKRCENEKLNKVLVDIREMAGTQLGAGDGLKNVFQSYNSLFNFLFSIERHTQPQTVTQSILTGEANARAKANVMGFRFSLQFLCIQAR